MKILAFADIHGSVDGFKKASEICQRERPDKVVFCGDLFGGWTDSAKEIAEAARILNFNNYFVRGNNDRPYDEALLPFGMEDNAVMYHFGRTLFFTHGDRYNRFRVPPLLKEGDVLVYGHTHVNLTEKRNGLFVVNVGSVSRPRDGLASYAEFSERGAALKTLQGEEISFLAWNDEK